MKKRLLLRGGLVLLVGVGIVCAIPECRYAMIGWLGIQQLYNGRPIGYWVVAIKEDDPSLRRKAALSLGDAAVSTALSKDDPRCPNVIAALVEALADRDGFVRKCAATSLLLYPKDTPMPQDRANIGRLTGALHDDEVVVRRAAVQALWQAGGAAKEGDGVARLIEAMDDKDLFVRLYAARALARIGPDAKAAVPTLLDHLREDPERDVRKLVAKTLGLIGSEGMGPQMPAVVEALKKALQEEPRGLREYSARALGLLGAREALPDLRQAAKDRDEQVRAAAVEAVTRLESVSTK